MYNEELKTKFAEEYTGKQSTRMLCRKDFNRAQPFEEKCGKDLCQMNKDEVKAFADEMASLRSSGKSTRTVLRAYAKWCIKNEIQGACDALFDIEFGTGKYKERTVSSPAHLQKCLDEVFHPESEGTLDNTARCAFWLVYSGIRYNDIFSVKPENVDLSNMVFNFKGIQYPIYREAIACVRNCINLTEFHVIRPTSTIVKQRHSGDTLLRGINSTSPDPIFFSGEASKKIRKALKESRTEIELTFYRVWLSGLFFKMYMDELMGIPPDFSAIVDEEYDLRNRAAKYNADKVRKIKEYEDDYQTWKSVLIR